MRRRVYFLALAAALLSPAAYADTVTGAVAAARADGIELTVYDVSGRPYPNTLRLATDARTRVAGVPSTALLRPGDPVRVEASQQRDGTWRADAVEKTGSSPQFSAPVQQYGVETVPYAAPAPGAAPPSNALMNALTSPTGQKVIRQGLSGAVVGGVASAASGGKLGKGALIGAGANVAAGFLTDWLTQPRPAAPTYAPAVAPPNRSASPMTADYSPERRVVRRYDAEGNVVSEEEFRR